MLEAPDANTLIDDWIDDSANLPLEMRRMEDEREERQQVINEQLKIISQRETSIQRWYKQHGSKIENPKEVVYRKEITEAQIKTAGLMDENIRLSTEAAKILDRRILAFDKGLKKLVDRGELPEDPELPSLLRPPPVAAAQPDRAADLMNSAFLPSSGGTPANSYRSGVGRSITGSFNQSLPQQNAAGQPRHLAAVPTISAIPPAVAAQRSRESSAGAPNKRPRIAGSLLIPPVQGNLARQSSLGPGTPKGSNLGSISRAGSAGPRPPKSAMTKKIGPPGKSSSRKSNLGKSGVNRIKRTKNGGSPSSMNDSEHSEGESGSDEEPSTPPTDRQGDILMEDEEADDKKYCICQSTSFGDMVACDNDKCPFEWFHWSCVGMTKEPVGSWFCKQPECETTMKGA